MAVTPVIKAISIDKHGDDDPPGDDHGQDNDDLADFQEDLNDDHPNATFSLTFLSGESVTGNLTFGHGAFLGDFTFGGVTYFFRAPQESSENHLANISTRGFVSTGQGQLIGGFIITGGPKLVLIRALGPSLAAFGVSPVLENPVLQLFSGSTNCGRTTTGRAPQIPMTSLPRPFRRRIRRRRASWCASSRAPTRRS